MKTLTSIASRIFLGLLLIVLLLNLPRLVETATGKITGWDEETKQLWADQVALNNQYVEVAKMRQELCREYVGTAKTRQQCPPLFQN